MRLCLSFCLCVQSSCRSSCPSFCLHFSLYFCVFRSVFRFVFCLSFCQSFCLSFYAHIFLIIAQLPQIFNKRRHKLYSSDCAVNTTQILNNRRHFINTYQLYALPFAPVNDDRFCYLWETNELVETGPLFGIQSGSCRLESWSRAPRGSGSTGR